CRRGAAPPVLVTPRQRASSCPGDSVESRFEERTMATDEPVPEPEPQAEPAPPADAVPIAVEPRHGRAWPALLVAGMLSAILTGATGEVTAKWVDPGGNSSLSPMEGGGPSLESIRRATLLNAALTYGVQGGTLGLLLGLAGAAVRRSIKGGLVGG